MKQETYGDIEKYLGRALTPQEICGVLIVSMCEQLAGRTYTAKQAAADIKLLK